MRNFKKDRSAGSVVFAVVMTIISLAITSVMWYVFYPVVEATANVVNITGGTNAALFSELLLNVWTWLGVIMLVNVLMWSFAYTVKRDWESQYA